MHQKNLRTTQIWKEVFNIRNELNDMHFNKDNPKFIDWNQDIPNIENELIITP